MMRLQQTGSGLGSDIVLTLRVQDEKTAQQVFRVLWATINAFDQRFSRFRTDSELNRVNQLAGQPTQISEEFQHWLQTALDYSRKTDGLYNPLLLPAIQRAGYVGSWPHVEKYQPQLDYRQQRDANSKTIRLEGQTVTLASQTALDSGGIGKGYLLDQLASLLDTKHVKDYWLSLGGDIICAGFDNDNQPWKVGIAKANSPQQPVAVMINDNGYHLAVATSGTTKRRGVNWHHIIDPRTGKPARTDVLTATVVSDSATAADVYAKCLVILGSEAAGNFITAQAIDGALLQTATSQHRFGVLA